MEVIEIAILTGLVVIAVLLILISVLLYKLRRIKKQREAKKPTEVKTKVKSEEVKKRKKLFSGILTKRRKSIEAKQYGIWK